MKAQDLKQYYRQHPRRVHIAGGILLLVVILIGLLGGKSDKDDGRPRPTAVVKRGPLTISISQSGTIRAMEQEIITCEVEGQTTLIYLIEEGTRVQEGDLLAEMDASFLQDGLIEQQIMVQNAEAVFIQAREQLAVVQNQSASDIAQAELDFRFAEEDLKQYLEGQYKQELMQAESKITLAEEELQLAVRKLEWSEKLYQENYLSQAERDTDKLAHNRTKLDLELAQSAKALLENYTYTRQVAQLESDVDQKTRALERVKLKANADTVQAEAGLKAKEAEWKQQQDKEEKLREQITKTRITASREGLVVYATSVRPSYRGNSEPLEEGQAVRERQELIYLPTADLMTAEIQLHESYLDQVKIGLPVILTVDALQGRTFLGQVATIAPLPDASSMWMNPDLKVYRTEIHLEGRQPDLRTGMSCMAEILVNRYPEATYVPVQSVLRVGNTTSVYVRKGGGFKAVPVKVGLDNNRMIHILEGLEPGQEVMLTPPLKESTVSEGKTPGQGVVDSDKLDSMIKDASTNKPAARTEAPANEEVGQRSRMTPEQREAMRKRMESMTPEQRSEMMKRMGGRGRPDGERGGSRGDQP